MLRPSNSLLGSSRAARRATVRAERAKAIGNVARGARSAAFGTISGVLQLVFLCVLPFLYLTAAYLVFDLPARWLSGREPASWLTLLEFVASIVTGLVGLTRAVQLVQPLAPVRPQFARTMFALAFVAGFLMTLGDLAS
jgi:hypothetical protein